MIVTYRNRLNNPMWANQMPEFIMDGNSVRAYHYPFCCTGLILACLGGSENEYSGNGETGEGLVSDINSWIAYFTTGSGTCHRKQFISVCTTDEQVVANAVLEELGFTRSEWMENHKYEGTRLCTWTLAIGHLNTYGEDDED